MTTHDTEQLALFLNGRDVAESGTAPWDKLPIDARASYLKDAEAILGALQLLGWTRLDPPTEDDRAALQAMFWKRNDRTDGIDVDSMVSDILAEFRRPVPLAPPTDDDRVKARQLFAALAAIFLDQQIGDRARELAHGIPSPEAFTFPLTRGPVTEAQVTAVWQALELDDVGHFTRGNVRAALEAAMTS